MTASSPPTHQQATATETATAPGAAASRPSPPGSPQSSAPPSAAEYASSPPYRRQRPASMLSRHRAAMIAAPAHESALTSYRTAAPTRRTSSPTPSVASSSSYSSSAPLPWSTHMANPSSPAETTTAAATPTESSKTLNSSTSDSNWTVLPSTLTMSAQRKKASPVWVSDGATRAGSGPRYDDASESTTYWEDCAIVEIKSTVSVSPPVRPIAGAVTRRRSAKFASTRPNSPEGASAPTRFQRPTALLGAAVALALTGAVVAGKSGYHVTNLLPDVFHPVRALQTELDRIQQRYRFLLGQRDALLVQRSSSSVGGVDDGVVYADLAQQVDVLRKHVNAKSQQLADELKIRQRHEDELFARLREARIQQEQMAERVQQKRDATLRLVRTLAYDRFGAGPHEVEFTVKFASTQLNNNETKGADEGRFVVRVASFEKAPLAPFWFLQQVEHGLWDRTSFAINAPHMVLAQPVSVPPTLTSRLPEMEAAGLNQLPLLSQQESDPQMHQARYALSYGYSSSTAGSFFYISRRNNDGAAATAAARGDGASVFARVVEGHDVVDRIASMETSPVDFRLLRPVEIVHARIVDAVEGRDDDHVPSIAAELEATTE